MIRQLISLTNLLAPQSTTQLTSRGNNELELNNAEFKSLLPFFPFFFLSIGWYCEAGVFGLIGYISLSLSLALLTSFNNCNNNNNEINFRTL